MSERVLDVLPSLDTALSAGLPGTLAGLALAAAVFIYSGQLGQLAPYRIAAQWFLRAFVWLLLTVVFDAGLFPLMEGVYTIVTGEDIEIFVVEEVVDVGSEYIFFLFGLGSLLAGAVKLAHEQKVSLIVPWPGTPDLP